MQLNLIEIWHGMGWPVRAVVIVLTAQALACITVATDRLGLLVVANRRAKKFSKRVAPLVHAHDYAGVLAVARETAGLHLARFVEAALGFFESRRRAGDGDARAIELTRRSVDRRAETLTDELNRGMNILASTGSTAPFVGLLGTVLGIINAFKLISANGSGGIGTIGAAIGESLIVTGYGLVVAIPTVLLYNALTHRIDGYEANLLRTLGELLDRLEMGEWDAKAPSSSVRAPKADSERAKDTRTASARTHAA
ncbi:MAG: MotA/TolQ/ExbB proton channel family protein [Polyangiales bacterium]|nr:MotA/TolQ/ExbB proton channel family protein [Myxococcales bacterium]